MELKKIGEISRDYIEKYMKLERSADRLLLSSSSTRLDDYKLGYQESLDALHGTDFETFLINENHLTPMLDHLTKKTNTKLRWSEYHPAPEALQLKLVLMRIVSGALLVYCDPLSFGYDAFLTGSAKANLPSDLNKKRFAEALMGLDDQGLTISSNTRIEMKRIALGKSAQKFPDLIENKQQLIEKNLLREIAILSNVLLAIDNGHANRLPIAITYKILSIANINFKEGWVMKHQKPFDGQMDGALSDNMIITYNQD
jgi:hypothetical protein